MNSRPPQSGNRISVHTATPADRAGWEKLYLGYAAFYQVEMTEAKLATVWDWVHDQNMRFWCLLACAEDHAHPVGLMHIREMPSPLRGCMIGFLDDLFVAPAARGTGVVDALFHALSQHAETSQWPCVRWITGDKNYRARGSYDRLATRTQWLTYQLDID